MVMNCSWEKWGTEENDIASGKKSLSFFDVELFGKCVEQGITQNWLQTHANGRTVMQSWQISSMTNIWLVPKYQIVGQENI